MNEEMRELVTALAEELGKRIGSVRTQVAQKEYSLSDVGAPYRPSSMPLRASECTCERAPLRAWRGARGRGGCVGEREEVLARRATVGLEEGPRGWPRDSGTPRVFDGGEDRGPACIPGAGAARKLAQRQAPSPCVPFHV